MRRKALDVLVADTFPTTSKFPTAMRTVPEVNYELIEAEAHIRLRALSACKTKST
ncbi:hypothetical protein [Bradyrhizobium sp. AC87j1]|uniref:hypothetical protein n=1 Tax=Bradyrhizobium sp. AC87j1 TaxID=2055894 RepID=UPI001374A3F4|nr:hypothetical protein [Bradyrhizobium sp. AC87j1]